MNHPQFQDVSKKLGIQRVLVVHAPTDGLDEISPTYPTEIFEIDKLSSKGIQSYQFVPKDCGKKGDLKVNSAKESAEICRRILYNEKLSEREEVMKAAVIVNAAMGIYVNLGRYPKEYCLGMAENSIEKGFAAKRLERLIEATN